MKTFRAWLRLPAAQRAMALEAALALLLARLFVELVPMQYWGRRLDTAPEPEATPAPRAAPENRSQAWLRLARTVADIVRKVARRTPFRAKCLPRAMAAQWMLRRRGVGSRLVFGARKGRAPEQTLLFHAWLIVAGECVVGGGEVEAYSAFPPLRRLIP